MNKQQGILFSSKKEWTDTHSNVDYSEIHCAKWKKPDLKRLSIYDVVLFIWVSGRDKAIRTENRSVIANESGGGAGSRGNFEVVEVRLYLGWGGGALPKKDEFYCK